MTATSPATMLVEFEPSAEADLDDRPCRPRLAEDDEGRERQQVEPGGVARSRILAPRGLERVERGFEAARQGPVVDVARIEADALVDPLDVWRGVAPDAKSSAMKRRLDQRRDRALALGARDMHGAERGLRVAEPRREVERRLEPDPHAAARTTLPVGQRVEPHHRRGKPHVIGHGGSGQQGTRLQASLR